MMFHSMKIYTVHVMSGADRAMREPVFIREGFNVFAFMFTGVWALYQRLWLPALAIIAINGVLISLGNAHVLSPVGVGIIETGFHLLIGFHANDWRRARLAKQGYALADITVADSNLRAQQRYFERAFAPA